ncbi:MAG TPA: HupE/UreJ family protein [Sphingobium sp.]
MKSVPRAGSLLLALALVLMATQAMAHGVGGRDAAFVSQARGPLPFAFAYLGARHMVTGLDHLLFLFGVIFFLRRARDIILYVSLFSLGHSITLLTGALAGFGLNAHLVDAAIGLSVVYKAFDNVGGFEATVGWRPDPRWTVLAFGLVHGLGLSTSLEALHLHREGLVWNLLAFNIGVEIGQVVALSLLLALLLLWRRTSAFERSATAFNWLLMAVGVALTGYQLAGYVLLKGPA